MDCPLCGSDTINELELIEGIKLNKIYSRLTGKSLDYLLDQNISQMVCEKCGLIFFNPMITGDEEFYSSLQKFDWYYLADKEEYQYARQYISSKNKVLDVGSGKGAFAKLLPTFDYVGLDLSVGAKDLAKENGVYIENETIQEHANIHQEEYDIVCSFQVLEHVSNPYEFIEAQLKALKSNGLLIVAVPSEDSFLKYVVNGVLNMPPHHVTRWSDESLKYIAKEFNLELINIHHEKVQKIHEKWYMSTLIQNSLLSPQLIDLSIRRKIVSVGSKILGHILIKGLKNELLPNGHSVICVYRKK